MSSELHLSASALKVWFATLQPSTESAIVSGALMLCGITILVALLLTLYGLLRHKSTTQ